MNIFRSNMSLRFPKFLLMGITLLLLTLSGCNPDGSQKIYGTISYNMSQSPSACYVILDDDTDPNNGYIQRDIIDLTATVTSVAYEIDTTDVSSGTYYLEAAWDFGDGNMDPDNDSVWEAKAWFGGIGSNPPGGANITNLNQVYNITLTGLE